MSHRPVLILLLSRGGHILPRIQGNRHIAGLEAGREPLLWTAYLQKPKAHVMGVGSGALGRS